MESNLDFILIQIKIMSLAECFPHAIVKDGMVYFISMSAFKDLSMDSSVDLKTDARMSVPVSAIEAALSNICVSDVGDIDDLMWHITLEDKARLVFCSSFCDDKEALFNEFCEYWRDKKPRIYKNTKVRFIKDDTVVMEMNV